jgi:hypothetical protein
MFRLAISSHHKNPAVINVAINNVMISKFTF